MARLLFLLAGFLLSVARGWDVARTPPMGFNTVSFYLLFSTPYSAPRLSQYYLFEAPRLYFTDLSLSLLSFSLVEPLGLLRYGAGPEGHGDRDGDHAPKGCWLHLRQF